MEVEKERAGEGGAAGERVCGFIDLSIWNGFLSAARNNSPLARLVTLGSVRHSFLRASAQSSRLLFDPSIPSILLPPLTSTPAAKYFEPVTRRTEIPTAIKSSVYHSNFRLLSTSIQLAGH